MVIKIKNSFSKKALFAFGLVFSLLLVVSVQAATRPIITILSYNTDTSITAGGIFNLNINLADQGSLCGIGTTVSVQAGYPFITTGVSSTSPVAVCNQTTVTIPLKIDPTTAGGSYPLTLVIGYSDWSNNFYSTSSTISLAVGGTPNLNANIVSSNPVDIYQGNTATITVLLENDGTYEAQSIRGTLYSNSSAEVSSSASFMYLSSLDSQGSANANFAVDIPKDSNTTQYPLILALQYLDQNRELETKNISLVLNTKKKAIFDVTTSPKSQGLYPNYNGRIVRLNVTNIGTDVANQMKVSIMPQFPFTSDGSVKYIDELTTGNSNILEFVVDVDKDATPGNYGVDLIFNYKDKEGNTLQDVETANLTVKSKSIFRAVFVDYWVIWVILILAAAIFFWKNKRFAHQRADLKEFMNNLKKNRGKPLSKKSKGG